MKTIIEYQVIRPSGTVLLQALAAEDSRFSFGREEPGFEIRGEMLTRYRRLPDGKWVVTARYPDGWSSEPELP